MPTALTLRFTATVPEDAEFEDPPGASLMRSLASKLTEKGWNPKEMDNWRDCGWFIVCRRASSELEVVVTWVKRGYWLLQIKPRRSPGIIGRLFGRKPSASPHDVYELALGVHQALSSLGYLGTPMWRWDGFPDEKHSTSEPQVAN